MPNSFALTKIVIIDSLEPREFQTGQLLETYIRGELAEQGLPLRVERHSVGWPDEFERVVHRLTTESAEHGEAPLLHVEMHGDPKDGLIFSEGGSMPWSRVSELLIDLNRATRFNLVGFFAACYGAHFGGELWVHRAAPCFGLLAPEDEVDPAELYQGFRRLYHELVVTLDMGQATALLAREKLSRGRWLNQTAATWFPQVLLALAKNHANAAELDAMALRVMARQDAQDLPKDIDMRTRVEDMALLYLRDLAFSRFFMVEDLPENAERFRAVKERAISEILPLVGKPAGG